MRIAGLRVAGLVLAVSMTLGACAHRPPYATEEFRGDGVAVEVSNHNWMDVVVYAVSYGNRVRLGNVTTGLDRRFTLPPSIVGQAGTFYLEAHPIGSNEVHRSDAIMVSPGNRIVWSLENQLGLSSYYVGSSK